jgi:hypothetical protein
MYPEGDVNVERWSQKNEAISVPPIKRIFFMVCMAGKISVLLVLRYISVALYSY